MQSCPTLAFIHCWLLQILSLAACLATEHCITFNKQGGMSLSPWHLLPLSRLPSKNATARKELDGILGATCKWAVKWEERGLEPSWFRAALLFDFFEQDWEGGRWKNAKCMGYRRPED